MGLNKEAKKVKGKMQKEQERKERKEEHHRGRYLRMGDGK